MKEDFFLMMGLCLSGFVGVAVATAVMHYFVGPRIERWLKKPETREMIDKIRRGG